MIPHTEQLAAIAAGHRPKQTADRSPFVSLTWRPDFAPRSRILWLGIAPSSNGRIVEYWLRAYLLWRRFPGLPVLGGSIGRWHFGCEA